jgi:hypothetical protein
MQNVGDFVGTLPLSKLARHLRAQARRVDVAVQHAKLKAEHLGRLRCGARPAAAEEEAALRAAADRLIGARQRPPARQRAWPSRCAVISRQRRWTAALYPPAPQLSRRHDGA